MDNEQRNKFSKITNNFDDIEIKKINYYNPSKLNENDDIQESTPKQTNLKYKNAFSQKSLSIKDKTKDLFNNKKAFNKQNEEMKNIDIDNNKNVKVKSTKYNNYFNNINTDNKGVSQNKLSGNENIKDILSQNKKIINDINNMINNQPKIKMEKNNLNENI